MKPAITHDDVDIVDAGDLDKGESRSLSRLKTSRERHSWQTYLLLPAIFLTVTLLGGLRLAANDNAFIFVKPALVCLVFAALAIVLYFRSGVIELGGWFSHDLSTVHNVANAAIVLTLFTATVQLFNSLLPEHGSTLWVIGFCFFWTLWNN